MAGPDVKMLNYILDLYVTFDKEQEENEDNENTQSLAFITAAKSFFYYAKNITRKAVDYITREEDVKKELTKICNQIITKINSPKIPEKEAKEWVDFCNYLGTMAEKAQLLKHWRSGPSRCCEIIHCVRNAIITAIKNDDGKFKIAYVNEIKRLNEELKTKQKERSYKIREITKNAGELELNIEINQLYSRLAYLEDPNAIDKAFTVRGLLPYLFSVEDREKYFKAESIAFNIPADYKEYKTVFPYALQPWLFQVHYCTRYQRWTRISFTDFCQNGIPPEARNKNNPPITPAPNNMKQRQNKNNLTQNHLTNHAEDEPVSLTLKNSR